MMPNTIETYIQFRQDLSSENDSYNDVDILIFCALAYLDFSCVEKKLPLTLREVYDLLIDNEHYQHQKQLRLKDYQLFELMAKSIRYRDIKLAAYCEIAEKETMTQFAAVNFVLPDGTLVVCYRGTDDSINGWREDFNMFTDEVIKARNHALLFLEQEALYKNKQSIWQRIRNVSYGKHWWTRLQYYQMLKKQAPIIVAGHSKGGNLALAASIHAVKLHARIKKVYNFDGPGLPESITDSIGFKEISEKTIAYLPGYSYFGRLFYHGEKQVYVKSCNEGMAQHDIHSWLVDAHGFILGELEIGADHFKKKADEFVERVGNENMKEFVASLFYVLEALGVEKMSEIQSLDRKNIIAVFHNLNTLNLKTRWLVLLLIQMMHQEMKNAKIHICLEEENSK